jgi:hypothetical protein
VEQLFWGLEQHELAVLLARLIVWLQQSPQARLEQPAGSSSTSSSRATEPWWWCMTCLTNLLDVIAGACNSKPESTAVLALRYMAVMLQYMEHLTAALDEAGRQQGWQ